MTGLPLCVGFGIKDPATAKAVAQLADGVVVGSVLVEKMGALEGQGAEVIATAAGEIAGAIRAALDSI
jgi:tryptophan synthase alpha chain